MSYYFRQRCVGIAGRAIAGLSIRGRYEPPRRAQFQRRSRPLFDFDYARAALPVAFATFARACRIIDGDFRVYVTERSRASGVALPRHRRARRVSITAGFCRASSQRPPPAATRAPVASPAAPSPGIARATMHATTMSDEGCRRLPEITAITTIRRDAIFRLHRWIAFVDDVLIDVAEEHIFRFLRYYGEYMGRRLMMMLRDEVGADKRYFRGRGDGEEVASPSHEFCYRLASQRHLPPLAPTRRAASRESAHGSSSSDWQQPLIFYYVTLFLLIWRDYG